MRISIAIGIVVALVAVTSAVQQNSAPWKVRIQPVDSPAGANSGEPRLSVSTKGVLLSWIERDGAKASLKYSERTTTGWTPAQTVASGTNWVVNWADTPSVVRVSDTSLVAHWLEKNPASAAAYDIRLARSTDNGARWSAAVTPHTDGTKSEHGFMSLLPVATGNVVAVWLDGREASSHGAAGEHGGAMSLRFATIDRTGKTSPDAPVDARVCDCCPTAAALTSDGPIVAFRDRSPDEIRDIAVTRFANGAWSQSAVVHADGWKIAGCPVNGPAIAARNRDVVVAWFTGAGNQNRSYAAFSRDAGRTFGQPVRLDENGTLGRVDVTLQEDGTALASWIEQIPGGTAEFRFRRIQPSGERSAPLTISTVGSDRATGFPRIARAGNELVAAWTETTAGVSRVRTAVAR